MVIRYIHSSLIYSQGLFAITNMEPLTLRILDQGPHWVGMKVFLHNRVANRDGTLMNYGIGLVKEHSKLHRAQINAFSLFSLLGIQQIFQTLITYIIAECKQSQQKKENPTYFGNETPQHLG